MQNCRSRCRISRFSCFDATRPPSTFRKDKGERLMARASFFLLLVTASLSFAPFTAAQPSPKVARIGYLSALDPARETSRAEAIRQALRQFGYIEGQNITVDYRYTLGKLESAPELAAELVRLKVDVIIVGGGSGPVHAAKNATTTIPIRMMAIGA